jgi:hypothetical protein
MDLHTFVQSILHGLLITFFNVAVFIAIWKHAVVIGMIHFMQYHSSHTPQMSHPFVIRCIVHHFHTEVLVTRLAILDQPIFIRMIKAALTLDGQRHWTPFHGLVDPYLAMLLQILTGTMWWKTLGGIFNVNRQQLFQLGITIGLSWLDAARPTPDHRFTICLVEVSASILSKVLQQILRLQPLGLSRRGEKKKKIHHPRCPPRSSCACANYCS